MKFSDNNISTLGRSTCQTSGQFCVILSQGTLGDEGNKRAGDYFFGAIFFLQKRVVSHKWKKR